MSLCSQKCVAQNIKISKTATSAANTLHVRSVSKPYDRHGRFKEAVETTPGHSVDAVKTLCAVTGKFNIKTHFAATTQRADRVFGAVPTISVMNWSLKSMSSY